MIERLKLDRLIKVYNLKADSDMNYYDRGIVYFQTGIYQRALEDFNEAIRLKSDYADAYNNRAFVYLKQGDNISGCRDA